jgi:signal transduction histidine kinase
LDRGGSIVYINAAWRRFAAENECPNSEAYFGANYLDICRRAAASGDALAARAFEGIGRVITGKAHRFRQRYPCHHGDVERWFMMTVTRAQHGRDIVVAHDDITPFVRTDEDSAALERQSSGIARIKNLHTEKSEINGSVFVADIGHELRTPLNAILGFSEIIRDQLFGNDLDRYSRYAEDIHKSGERLLNVIVGVLELAKIEAGKLELHETWIKLDEHISKCLKSVGAQAERGGVNLKANAAGSNIEIAADGAALSAIIINLLSNAIKFTAEGGDVRLSATVASDGCLGLTVRDTGVGMSAEEILRAVEPFKQVGSKADKPEGAGLGLTLAARLAELHGGSLHIDSTPGLGTSVTIKLPAWRVRRTRPSRAIRN